MKVKCKEELIIFLVIWLLLIIGLVVAIFAIGQNQGEIESLREAMRDSVLHDVNKMSLFGLPVNPALISDFVISLILLQAALVIRIFVIPRFKTVPGKFQAVLGHK